VPDRVLRILAALALIAGVPLRTHSTPQPKPGDIQVLRAQAALPPHLTGQFGEAAAFQQMPGGDYFVFDRRGHAVYAIDTAMTEARRVVRIGVEAGRVLEPFAFRVGQGEFVIGDAPGRVPRVQLFVPSGSRLSGFRLPAQTQVRVVLDGVVLNGIGSLDFTRDRTILLNQPETGALVAEYDVRGRLIRSFGTLRPTGHESDSRVHLALNAALPLAAPDGGTYVVFVAGRPAFRLYDRDGRLVFERAIQGRELDDLLNAQPQTWPRRTADEGEIPLVAPVIRTAAVDPRGRLWISLVQPVTYLYDGGEKVGTFQFRAAGIIRPTSLFFTADGRVLVTPGCYIFRTP